jgi:hypothetical protein
MAEQARQLTTLMQRYNSGDSFEAPAPVAQPRAIERVAAAVADRRTPARPWAAKSKPPVRQRPAAVNGAAASAPPPAQPIKAAANGSDADWMEF